MTSSSDWAPATPGPRSTAPHTVRTIQIARVTRRFMPSTLHDRAVMASVAGGAARTRLAEKAGRVDYDDRHEDPALDENAVGELAVPLRRRPRALAHPHAPGHGARDVPRHARHARQPPRSRGRGRQSALP